MKIENKIMDLVATYMDDEIREKVHFELCPCTNEEFLKRYCEYDDTFSDFLLNEFNLVID